jgi:two-component system, OmpR family, phosphate regulon response regulator PhoB
VPKLSLLLVEDDPAIAALIGWTFERHDFRVTTTPSGEEALLLAIERPFDVVILDWMLEDLSGIEVCRRLRRNRETGRIPVIMLSARAEESDRIRGLETGADDYMTKPFSQAELLARVQALLRRAQPGMNGATLRYEDLEVDLASHKVRRGGRRVPMGPKEYQLLRHLMKHPGQVFSREKLVDLVWGQESEVEIRTVDVIVRRLRVALNAGGEADLIRTVRSAGYALDADA